MTGESGLPAAVRAFVLKHLDSVAELEALLLVRSTADAWSAADLARRLYIRDGEAAGVLHALHRRGLIARDGDLYSYDPADGLRAEVDALAEAYPRFLIAISTLIHDKPRTSLRNFADAFRLRDD